ncbi:MAG: nitrite reductase small subunit NirD, partial [Deltaproteobacteria bacterium]|nr:nitrite reductase small subunit NirD [Deltaproteobacteria bacterium]
MKWHPVIKISDLQPGEGKTVNVYGTDIALFRIDEKTFKAIDNLCPHKGGSLGEGTLKNDCVVCPLHQWTFDLETGKNIRNSECQLQTYAVKVE